MPIPSLPVFYERLDELERLNGIHALLEWDQQVNMPPGGASARAAQIEFVTNLRHARLTSPDFHELVEALWDRREELQREEDVTNVRETRRLVLRERKLSADFLAERSRAHSHSYNAWVEARSSSSFSLILPHLTKIIDLCRREAECVGYEDHPYDALLDLYEPGATLRRIKPLLEALGEELRQLIRLVRCDDDPLRTRYFEQNQQFRLFSRVAADIGYDLQRGRIDRSLHPFQSTIGFGDVRITAKYEDYDYLSGLLTVLHEAGHALYEQGFSEENRGTPMASAVSLGVHESQSRLWENIIGRSRPFAVYLHTLLGEFFPEEQSETSPERLWRELNRVKPSLIRVEADEVTYSLHIVIRLVLEEGLMTGTLSAADLPDAWQELYERYLGVKVENPQDGVLQDIHWYVGLIGYFPTYALGNLYGAQMFERVRQELPQLDKDISRGNFQPLLSWLRTNIHRCGSKYQAHELIERLSGRPLSIEPFICYLRKKFAAEGLS